MAEILHTLSIISFVLAVLFVVIAIIFWFVFKIPNVIGDLSGHNARKSIAQMRQNNEKTGDKSYKASKKNLDRGKLTRTMEGIGEPGNKNEETGLLNENLVKEREIEDTGLLWIRMRRAYLMNQEKLLHWGMRIISEIANYLL